jgi:AcrR family transcriptional regulator
LETKEKILKAALMVFNKRGTELVTVRELAKEIGISHGNLCYHFPNSDHIISQLYFELAAKMDKAVLDLQSETKNPEDIFKGSRVLFDLLYEYRFLMLNFVDIMRRIPTINKHYRKLQERRKLEFKQVFKILVEAGLMRPEIYPSFFDDLIVNMTILGDFWISHAEILFTGKEKEKTDYFFRVTGSILLPMLTSKGLGLFLKTK